MPRYIFVATVGDIIYGDTKDEPGPEPTNHLDALRQLDENIGESGLSYDEVAKDDPEASLHVYRAAGIVRNVETDATYVTSIKVSPPAPTP